MYLVCVTNPDTLERDIVAEYETIEEAESFTAEWKNTDLYPWFVDWWIE